MGEDINARLSNAISDMEGSTGYKDTDLGIATRKMSGVPVGSEFERAGYLYTLRDDLRSEFRGIYESIIDSTLAGMYS